MFNMEMEIALCVLYGVLNANGDKETSFKATVLGVAMTFDLELEQAESIVSAMWGLFDREEFTQDKEFKAFINQALEH